MTNPLVPMESNPASLAPIADACGLKFKELLFMCFRKVGYSQMAAYSVLYPKAQEKSATTSASRYEKKIRAKIAQQISLEEAIKVLSDYARVRGVVHGDAEIALKAADQVAKTRGHYQQKEPQEVNPLTILINLGRQDQKEKIRDAEFTLLDPRALDDQGETEEADESAQEE